MDFAEFNWMQIEAYLVEDDRLMIVLGATEQHGYLSVFTDTLVPHRLAQAASEQTGVLVAPPMPFGSSPYFLAYPGTISLQLSTLMSVLKDMIGSFYQHGFRRFIVLNGHGGNRGAKSVLDEAANELPGMTAYWYDWWLSPAVGEISEKAGLTRSHANWLEAFDFTTVTELPDGEKPFAGPAPSMQAERVRQHYGDGSFGGAYQAPGDVMEAIFEACAAEVVALLNA
ncbi:MAG: creatininase family protein [Anaerolineales bacterium]